MSGESILSEKLLANRVNLNNYPEVKEVLSLFSVGRMERIDSMITTEQQNNYWKKANERTSLPYSRLYFGYYKVHTLVEELVEIKYQIVNLAIKNGQPLKRLLQGVSIVLEKPQGIQM